MTALAAICDTTLPPIMICPADDCPPGISLYPVSPPHISKHVLSSHLLLILTKDSVSILPYLGEMPVRAEGYRKMF